MFKVSYFLEVLPIIASKVNVTFELTIAATIFALVVGVIIAIIVTLLMFYLNSYLYIGHTYILNYVSLVESQMST